MTATFQSRWGDSELDDHQYVTIPGFILRNYHQFTFEGNKVGLDADEFQTLCHIMSFKYDVPGAKASPSLQTVADQMGKHVSSVRRTVKKLKDKNAVKVIPNAGKNSVYDFGELVRQCREFEKLSLDATPSADASTSTNASTTPSADASTPLAQTLDEDLNKESKNQNSIAQPKTRKRSDKQLALDGMKNALADAFGLDHAKVTSPQWDEFSKAGKELLKVGAKPEEMKPLHDWCVAQRWKTFSSMAMAKNYANFAKTRPTATDGLSMVTSGQKTREVLLGREAA